MIKIAIVDDDQLIIESLKILLTVDGDIEVVATGQTGKEAIDIVSEQSPDILLLDLRMPGTSGIDALKEIGGRVKTMVLTTFDEEELLVEAIKNGADTYLLKNETPQTIREAIRSLHGGKTTMSTKLFEKLKTFVATEKKQVSDQFTPREIQIIKAIGEGLSNREIASQLFLSEGTVKNHITVILQKSGMSHRTQIAVAYHRGEL